jgi:hypothetical protein
MLVEKGKSPKLQIPVDGPYEVRKVQSHTYTVRTANGIVTINSGRVTKAPAPRDLHTPLPLFSRAKPDNEVEDNQRVTYIYTVSADVTGLLSV